MKTGRALLLAIIAATLSACGGKAGSVTYTVKVTSIDLAAKGGTKSIEVDGLPSASATLTQPGQRYSGR
jgi:hypothetical protein